MIDYEEIINNLEPEKVKELVLSLGAEQVIERDNYFITNTICHNPEGGSMKLYYYYENHGFVCYTNADDGFMTIFKFLEHYYTCRGIEYDWYNDIYSVVKNCSPNSNPGFKFPKPELIGDRYSPKRKEISLSEYPHTVMNNFVTYYPIEWLEDGITVAAMEKFGIKYSIGQNKVIIPHYDATGRLVGIRGRALDPEQAERYGKYMPVYLNGVWYKHPLSMNLYGLYENKENIKRTGIVFIAESEKSVLQAESFSRPNCVVAACGSSLNKYQINILMKECAPREFVLCFDKEQLKNYDKYFDKLYKMCKKYSNYGNFSFIYDRKGLLDLKDSPFDKGEEVFEQLLKERAFVK